MGLPVTVFRSTDEGVPVIQPTKPSDWLKIIQACLVDGYGSKQPLGWTLEFGDLDSLKMVFKNNNADGGSGGAVQIEAHSGSDSNRQHVRFTAANGITALDTYFEKAGYRTIATMESEHYCRGWTLVGCGRSFYIRPESGVLQWNSTNSSQYKYNQCLWIGDVQSFIPNDQHIFTIVSSGYIGSPSSNSTTNDYRSCQFGAPGREVACQLYAADSSGSSVDYYSADSKLSSASIASSYSNDPIALGVPADMSPVLMTHSNYSNVANPAVRAIVPGLFKTNFLGYWGADTPIIRNLGGIDYEFIYGLYVANFAVQTSGEWYD